MKSGVICTKADDAKSATFRKTSHKKRQGIIGYLHSIRLPHRSTAVDKEDEVKVVSWTQLDRLWLLVLHHLEEVLG